jgi:hypothetical protein
MTRRNLILKMKRRKRMKTWMRKGQRWGRMRRGRTRRRRMKRRT